MPAPVLIEPIVPSETPTPPAAKGVHAFLRRGTAAEHTAIEAALNLDRRLGDREGYRALLAAKLGFYAPMEQALAGIGWGPVAVDLGARRKVPLLMADLAALGLDPGTVAGLPRCRDLPELGGTSAALGCLYVLEGATLGGRVILRLVDAALGLGPETGASFFRGYGAHTGAMWRETCALLERHLATPTQRAEALAAARATFESLRRWLVANA